MSKTPVLIGFIVVSGRNARETEHGSALKAQPSGE